MLPTVFLALVVAAPAVKDKPKAAPSLVGTWVVESTVVGGQPSQPEANPERWVFNADGSRTAGRTDAVPRRGTYTIDPKADPPTLDLVTDPTVRHLCVFRVDGDTLTINIAWVKADRPTGLDCPVGAQSTLRTFKRVRTDGGKP